MKIDFPDDIAKNKMLTDITLLEILAVSLYKMQKINGVEGGIIIGKSEMEFHGLLEKHGQYINYDMEDLQQDIDNLKDL